MDRPRRVWWGIAEVGMAFAGLVVGWLVIGTLMGLVELGPLHLAAGPLITGVAAVFYAFTGPRWAAATRDEDDDRALDSGLLPPLPPRPGLGPVRALGVVVLGVVVALGGSIVLGIVLEWLGWGVQEQSSVLEIVEQARAGGPPAEAIVLAACALLLAPVVEEALFRRLLFVRVLASSGRPLAYGLSALAFAAIHGNPAGIVIYFWLGLVFAAVLERTGRWWAAIAVHMGNNGYVLLVLFFGVDPGG